MKPQMSAAPHRARPKARLSSPIRPMLVATFTLRKADHGEKRDPRSADNKRRKHMELDNDARLEKRKCQRRPATSVIGRLADIRWPKSAFSQFRSVLRGRADITEVVAEFRS
jgi:hypothetical protein